MKLLRRDTSASPFMVNGGLFSNRDLPRKVAIAAPKMLEDYVHEAVSFGVVHGNVVKWLTRLLASLGWPSIKSSDDLTAKAPGVSILFECKKYKPDILYLDEYQGSGDAGNAVEQLQQGMVKHKVDWGVLTDGVTFRLYKASDDPALADTYLEVCLGDISRSRTEPQELGILLDFLSPNSQVRKLDVSPGKISQSHLRTILKTIDTNYTQDKAKNGEVDLTYFETVMKSLVVASLEDLGVIPLHRATSIKTFTQKKEFLEKFESITPNDCGFHLASHRIDREICERIHQMFQKLKGVDFAHIDHAFFGEVYQKLICNGNSSHYTSTELSREMADYIANRSEKSQARGQQNFNLLDAVNRNAFILDPALGSGQLLRALLPFHKAFTAGRTSGVDGWRSLAEHFMGRDCDERAVWVAKLNIWLSTAKKGARFVDLREFKHLDVIDAVINRAGHSYKQAFEISDDDRVVGVISNPPWDAFKNDSRRGVKYEDKQKEQIQASLNIRPRQLNRAQVFTKIIQQLGQSEKFRFSIILPDSFFIDTNDGLRNDLRQNIDFYFSYPRNTDHKTGKTLFPFVDGSRKFGIIFGRTQTQFRHVNCYPLGKSVTPGTRESGIQLTHAMTKIGEHDVFPLFSDLLEKKIVERWVQCRTHRIEWFAGEFDTSLWRKRKDRRYAPKGEYRVVSGTSFCLEGRGWSSATANRDVTWKRFAQVTEQDAELAKTNRLVFSDYINNSKKLNNSSITKKLNITNSVLYSLDYAANDNVIYDSPIFSTFVRLYSTSQHMNAWRLNALGIVAPTTETVPLVVSGWLGGILGLTEDEWMGLYTLNAHWLSLEVDEDTWREAYQDAPFPPGGIRAAS